MFNKSLYPWSEARKWFLTIIEKLVFKLKKNNIEVLTIFLPTICPTGHSLPV